MAQSFSRVTSAALLVLLLVVCVAAATAFAATARNVFSPVLQKEINDKRNNYLSTFDVLVYFNEQMNYGQLNKMFPNINTGANANTQSNDLKAQYMVNKMMSVSQRTQSPVYQYLLKERYISADALNSLWVSNALAVRGISLDTLNSLVARFEPVIDRIVSDKPFRQTEHSVEFETMLQNAVTAMSSSDSINGLKNAMQSNGVEWNLPWVQATDMWDLGFRGEGISVAIADTGIQYDHPALVGHYRGNLGNGKFEHNYNWWDAIKKPLSSRLGNCGVNATAPCDDQGHGTHCTGTVVGATADGNRQIGVAPGAKFIGCRNMHVGIGRPSTYIDCLQFMVAPTDLAGRNPDPSKRPHVISNSYGCPRSEECEPSSLQEAAKFVRAAGIFMAVAAGNEGPSCSTVGAPPGTYGEVYSVAALGVKTNKLAYFSSRGPVTADGSRRRKPDISAPGSSIVSAYPPNGYSSLSGTSMATPHVAGVVALLWNAVPKLARNVELTEAILNQSALPVPTTECSSPTSVPNNLYGYGVIQTVNAYKNATSRF